MVDNPKDTESPGRAVVVTTTEGRRLEVPYGEALAPDELRDESKAPDIAAVIELAVKKGTDPAIIERLVAVAERLEDRRAERAMSDALARFRAEVPPIPKTGLVDYVTDQGYRVKYRHATREGIARIIDPLLARHGLSYGFNSELLENPKGWRRITCELRHYMGATRTAHFDSPPAGTPKSSDVQKAGAALSYGMRYTLVMVTGLAHTEDDVDGLTPGRDESGGERVSEEQLAILKEWVETSGADLAKLCRFLKVEALSELPAARFDYAVGVLKRKAEQGGATDD